MAFCQNCGSALTEGNRFCGSCGRPVTDAPPSQPPQYIPPPPAPIPAPVYAQQPVPNSQSERVIGAIPVIHKKNMFSVESYDIVVTERRLIFALMTNDMVKEEAKKHGKDGFLAGMVGAMTIGYTFYKRYLTMDPEMALRENPQNYQLELNQIRGVRLQLGARRRDPQKKIYIQENSKLTVEALNMKYTFEVVNQFHDLASDVLSRARLI
jgi:hypothetical protein